MHLLVVLRLLFVSLFSPAQPVVVVETHIRPARSASARSYGLECFKDFELTDTIAERLDGKATNLVKTMGWYVIGLFCVGCLLLCTYYWWVARHMKAMLKQVDSEAAAEEGGGKSPRTKTATTIFRKTKTRTVV